MTEVHDNIEILQTALDEALYHADNLQRYIDGKPVRDLAESRAGCEHARSVLRNLREPS